MLLSDAQQAEYEDKGYVLVPSLLTADELRVLEQALADISRYDGPEVKREKDGALYDAVLRSSTRTEVEG